MLQREEEEEEKEEEEEEEDARKSKHERTLVTVLSIASTTNVG
jgi:hypothetical protein